MNLFRILNNTITVVGITCMGNGFECRIYARLILINIHIGDNLFCGRGGRIEFM